jgi:hypothetical protein
MSPRRADGPARPDEPAKEHPMTELAAGWSTPDLGAPAATPAPTAAAPPPVAVASRVGRGLLPLRPMAAGEVLDGAVAVARAYPRPVLAFAAVTAVVSAVLDLVVTLTLLGPVTFSFSGTDTGTADQLLGQSFLSRALTGLVSLVTQGVMAGAVTVVVGRAVFGEPTTLRQTWQQVRSRLRPLVGLSLLVGLAVWGVFAGSVAVFALLTLLGPGGALLGLPVLLAGSALAVRCYVRWSLAPAALVLEGQGVRAALRRSTVLVQRDGWRVLGILLLGLGISLTVAAIVQLPFSLLGHNPFSTSGTVTLTTRDIVVGAVSGALATVLVAPFSAGVRALLYVDRRMRAEGLDVALVAAAAGRR